MVSNGDVAKVRRPCVDWVASAIKRWVEEALQGHAPGSRCAKFALVEVDRDPIVEMCLSIDGYNTGRTSPTVRSNVGCFSGQMIEDLRPI